MNHDDLIDHIDKARAIAKMLRWLTPREQKVIELRFGLNRYSNGSPIIFSLEEIANHLSLTEDEVLDIEFEAMQKMGRTRVVPR